MTPGRRLGWLRLTRSPRGIVTFVSQGSRTGMIVLIIVAAGIRAVDAHRGLATFYGTRVAGPSW